MPEIISRADAKRAGLKRYFTGEACPRGHVAERYVPNGSCPECVNIRNARPDVKEKRKAYHTEYMARPGRKKAKAEREKERMSQPCVSEARKKYWANYKSSSNGKDVRARHRHKKRYGEPLSKKMKRLEAQDMCCAICGANDPGNWNWSQDHDHTTGKVRDVLCHRCNAGLGFARDSIPVLKAMIAYLERHSVLHQTSCLEEIARLGGVSARCAEIFNAAN